MLPDTAARFLYHSSDFSAPFKFSSSPWRTGMNIFPHEFRALVISVSHVFFRSMSTAMMLAPCSRSISNGPIALVAPISTKYLSLRSSHVSWLSTTSLIALAADISIVPYSAHFFNCFFSMSPSSSVFGL